MGKHTNIRYYNAFKSTTKIKLLIIDAGWQEAVTSVWTCRCPHPASSLLPSVHAARFRLVETVRKLNRLVQVQ